MIPNETIFYLDNVSYIEGNSGLSTIENPRYREIRTGKKADFNVWIVLSAFRCFIISLKRLVLHLKYFVKKRSFYETERKN
ncbi:MAG: hypothetical protein ACJAQ7_000504 [Sediminicola sp.]|jgi:hypothetical protein